MFFNSKILLNLPVRRLIQPNIRTFLSQAYSSQELWNERLKDPIFEKLNLDTFYTELDQKFQRTRTISALDVDLFANMVNEETYTDELLDLVYKLRLSADTCNTFASTPHAVIRYLTHFNKDDRLLKTLNDRLNFGIFLDSFTANLLLDKYWKSNEFCKGSQVAAQIMLQEDFGHPINDSLSLLHCYNYLRNPTEWPQVELPAEPEDDVKVRVKYLRNPYFDDHFDLTDGFQLVGKTLMAICKEKTDVLSQSLYLTGLALYGKESALNERLKVIQNENIKLYDAFNLIPESNSLRAIVSSLETEQVDINKMLVKNVEEAVKQRSDEDIKATEDNYNKWRVERQLALKRQQERVLRAQRLAKVEETRQSLEEKERLLWYFENEEKIELALEEHQQQSQPEEEIKTKSKAVKDDVNYIPPEIVKRRN